MSLSLDHCPPRKLCHASKSTRGIYLTPLYLTHTHTYTLSLSFSPSNFLSFFRVSHCLPFSLRRLFIHGFRYTTSQTTQPPITLPNTTAHHAPPASWQKEMSHAQTRVRERERGRTSMLSWRVWVQERRRQEQEELCVTCLSWDHFGLDQSSLSLSLSDSTPKRISKLAS